MNFTQQQIEKLNNLPPCKNCGQKLDTKKIMLLKTGINLYHSCDDESAAGDDNITIISLQGVFDYVVDAWVGINTDWVDVVDVFAINPSRPLIDVVIVNRLNLYAKWVLTKLPDLNEYDLRGRLAYGLCEACEVIGVFDKVIWQGHEFDEVKLKKELGDFLFYLIGLCEVEGFNFGEMWTKAKHKCDVWKWDEQSDLTPIENYTIDYTLDIVRYAIDLAQCVRYREKGSYNTKWFIERVLMRLKGLFQMWELDILEIIELNQVKLNRRYPDGFSVGDSIERVDQQTPLPYWDEVEAVPFEQPSAKSDCARCCDGD
jgi:hypothetical protein